ncbi:hypothetical protein [Natronolimnohabitans innermongolicus]|uniref:Right handed beta helix domain-containing protein n=1 Tax=Natronolimnohabitans innermongolicus JCM 12255 TaxID=1227499 RepID=L9XJ29_9EURY|nr:hypothetical protein [Natronolimnohabitans innermongolicus]ELY61759.1 hypothetical protein C493_01624 [Natronolimnohabitans innermongolicus JCM 12255]
MTGNDSHVPQRSRRSYLTGCLAAVGALSIPGLAAGSELGDEYGTVVDVVEAGADNEGGEPVTPVLREHVADDTLLKFPEGRYYMDEQLRATDFENLGFVGENATLVPATYHKFDGPQYRLFRLGTADAPGRDLRFENFDVDQTADETGIRVVSAQVSDGLSVRNVTIHGTHDSGTWGPGLFNVTDPDGEGIVDCFYAIDGAVHVDETPNADQMWRGATGITVDQHHRGTLVFHNCRLGGFPDNGLYASSETGRVGVDGGRYQNSGTASIRLDGSRAEIRNADVIVDADPHGSDGQHAIRLDGGRAELAGVTVDAPAPNGDAIRVMNDVESATIAETELAVGDAPSNAIRVSPGAGRTTVRDVDVEIAGSANAIRLLGDDAHGADLERVRITGDAPGTRNRHAIYCERHDCRFVDLSVDQPGADNRRGLDLRGADYLVADSEFETTHTPIVVDGATDVTIENTAARSLEDGYSVRIVDGSGTVSLSENEFPNGVRDDR